MIDRIVGDVRVSANVGRANEGAATDETHCLLTGYVDYETDRQTALVLLASRADDTEAQLTYFFTRLRAERLGADTVAARPMSNRSRPRSSSAAPS